MKQPARDHRPARRLGRDGEVALADELVVELVLDDLAFALNRCLTR
jgi:hypothetical protein